MLAARPHLPAPAPRAAYFGFLGMLALTATLDTLVSPFLPEAVRRRRFDLSIPKIPVVLAVRPGGLGGNSGGHRACLL